MENDFFSMFWYWKSGEFFPKISKIVQFTPEKKKNLQKKFPCFCYKKKSVLIDTLTNPGNF